MVLALQLRCITDSVIHHVQTQWLAATPTTLHKSTASLRFIRAQFTRVLLPQDSHQVTGSTGNRNQSTTPTPTTPKLHDVKHISYKVSL